MKNQRLIVCAKDIGAFNVTGPLAIMARDKSLDVHIVTEGKAAERFRKAGLDPDFKGTEDFKKEPFDFNAELYLRRVGPSIVVVGTSSPANLEITLGRAANKLGYPVVECQDIWRAHVRLPDVTPSLVLTVDEYAARLAEEDLSMPKDRVVIVGNPGAKRVVSSPRVNSLYGELLDRNVDVFYYAGAGSATSEELRLLVACLAKTRGTNALVVGFHPKKVKEFGAEWRGLLSDVGGDGDITEAEPGTGEEWSSIATTIAGFSTLLTTAVYHFHPAIALRTPATMASLKRQNALEEIPQVVLGYAHEVSEPTDLSGLGYLYEGAKKILPYDSNVAWDAVRQLV